MRLKKGRFYSFIYFYTNEMYISLQVTSNSNEEFLVGRYLSTTFLKLILNISTNVWTLVYFF